MDALLHSPWSAVIGLAAVLAWALMLCAIFFPGKPRGNREDGWF